VVQRRRRIRRHRAAESAARADHAVFTGQPLAFSGAIGRQHARNPIRVAMAAEVQRLRRLPAPIVFVEQPPQQGFGLKCGIHQLHILDRLQEQRQPLPLVIVMGPFRRCLQHDAARAPVRCLRSRREHRCGRQPDCGRQLLALREIGFGRCRYSVCGQFDNTLISLPAQPGFDGDGQCALARQLREIARAVQGGKTRPIQPRKTAQARRQIALRTEIIHGHKVERPVRFGLQRQPPIELQRRTQNGGQRHAFPRDAGRGFRQGMGGKRARRRPVEPDQPPAAARIGQIERQNEIRRRGGRVVRLIAHRSYMGMNGEMFKRPPQSASRPAPPPRGGAAYS